MFEYPSRVHARTKKPKKIYKRYSTYRSLVKAEFERKCVYCRLSDGCSRSVIFSIDHYKPKKLFPELICDYDNLFYCCHACNSIKSSYWPKNKSEPMVLNPCSHAMTNHVRINKSTGSVDYFSKLGAFFVEFFDLNNLVFVEQRKSYIHIENKYDFEIQEAKKALVKLQKSINRDKIPSVEKISVKMSLENKIQELSQVLEYMRGESPVFLSSRH